MTTTTLPSATSRVRWGFSRADITPPVGIYHGFWGAARHDRATGVHQPLFGDVVAVGAANDVTPGLLWALIDVTTLPSVLHMGLLQALSQAAGLPIERTVISWSHTHASGWFNPDRLSLQGGELIPGYLAGMQAKLQASARQAVANMREVDITYALGRCNMAANRDYWDAPRGCFVCGLNPDVPADDTVFVARVTDRSGNCVAVLVNYACHPTTLSYENTEISPDFVGSMRAVVAQVTGAPCIFIQGASGDLAPRYDYVGGIDLADQNGRWLAYAALAAVESMGPPATDYCYRGTVVSGATLGIWEHVPFAAERLKQVSHFEGDTYTVELPLKPRPHPVLLQQEFDKWVARQCEARSCGDMLAARDYGARAERARRGLSRLAALPDGATVAYRYAVYRLGDAVWVMCGAEPYSLLQTELRRRFSHKAILLSGVSGGPLGGYMVPRSHYGKGLYQEETCLVATGSLEQVIDAIAERIGVLLTAQE